MTGLQHQHFGQEEIIVIAAPNHSLCDKKEVFARDLETLPFTEQGCYYRNQFETHLFRQAPSLAPY